MHILYFSLLYFVLFILNLHKNETRNHMTGYLEITNAKENKPLLLNLASGKSLEQKLDKFYAHISQEWPRSQLIISLLS